MPKEQLTYMHLYIYSISFTLLNPCKFFVKKQSETFFSEDFIFLSILSESSKQRNVCQVSSCQTFTRNLSNDLSLQRLRNKRYWKLFHVKIYLRQKFLQRKVWTAKNLYGKKSQGEISLRVKIFTAKSHTTKSPYGVVPLRGCISTAESLRTCTSYEFLGTNIINKYVKKMHQTGNYMVGHKHWRTETLLTFEYPFW